MKREYYDFLYKTLTSLRKEKNLSQEEVAMLLGKPQSFVSKYENGERRLDLIEILYICKKLNISPHDLINRMDEIFDE
ncbi:TPA: helix-turn-helix transcriptional regulator [Acinetobacter baumannii]|jgi:transcriptional regulator with XRE-family HTH domain|uniref:helix-turn-helix domain-containing protein n=1 Tax=Acinetobacter pittii TaxID=48296 RepID=UPI0009C57AC2|nr:helix-turn-helix transcriptional regulator [Acinetobacter pittii]MCU4342580.1 helix-turn-helix domain-containing protein [Acinetobacter pittii]OON24193.1 hypothetical protein BI372_02775 [Acinetobacter pittii]